MKRNKFNLSHYHLMSCQMGSLIPIGIYEVNPGDTVQQATSMLIRCTPLVTPVMHPCHARVHHWFVPFRLLWNNWESFITGGPNGMDASVFPYIDLSGVTPAVGSLMDYLGIPAGGVYPSGEHVSALPFRAYALIFNEWYRDQDLVTQLTMSTADGADSTTSVALQNIAWEKDYFTTCRPWTQKGPEVTIPVNLTGVGVNVAATGASASPTVTEAAGNTTSYPQSFGMNLASAWYGKVTGSGPNAVPDIAGYTDINQLRFAFAMQRYEEARARYGSRYSEYLRYLGVTSPDARLQRPEYLGGGKQTIQFSEVLQTGVTSSGSAGGVGNLAGHGIGALRSNRFRRFFNEHGFVISLMSIKPRTMYAQSLHRLWSRKVKEDFWQPELEHIGQQEVYNREVYSGAPGSVPGNVFGYQDRYDDFRRVESRVSGQFRQTTYDMWHMARIFATQPVLNASFVTCTPTNRIFADQTGDDTMLMMISHSIQARRMMARTGTSFIR